MIGTLRLDGLVFIPKVEVSGHRCVNWVWQLLFTTFGLKEILGF